MYDQPPHRQSPFSSRAVIGIVIGLIVIVGGIFIWLLANALREPQNRSFLRWWRGDDEARAGLVTVQREACPGAPFILPADGFIGLLYGDARGPYSRANPHQGIDIFSPDSSTPGLVPVYAAFDGYITREQDWNSTLIQRVPSDPLNPERQIWLYYTHMADSEGNDFIEEAFPQGVREFFVEQGTLLGHTGNYNGNSPRSIWVHLHFSIVLDDGNGRYLNELEFSNTVDPSPYLSMPLNENCSQSPPTCSQDLLCQ
jgi:hypothetical protein